MHDKGMMTSPHPPFVQLGGAQQFTQGPSIAMDPSSRSAYRPSSAQNRPLLAHQPQAWGTINVDPRAQPAPNVFYAPPSQSGYTHEPVLSAPPVLQPASQEQYNAMVRHQIASGMMERPRRDSQEAGYQQAAQTSYQQQQAQQQQATLQQLQLQSMLSAGGLPLQSDQQQQQQASLGLQSPQRYYSQSAHHPLPAKQPSPHRKKPQVARGPPPSGNKYYQTPNEQYSSPPYQAPPRHLEQPTYSSVAAHLPQRPHALPAAPHVSYETPSFDPHPHPAPALAPAAPIRQATRAPPPRTPSPPPSSASPSNSPTIQPNYTVVDGTYYFYQSGQAALPATAFRKCQVYACGERSFCALEPCGCRICREHLRVDVLQAVQTIPSINGPVKKYSCVVCGTTSTDMGPGRPEMLPGHAPEEDTPLVAPYRPIQALAHADAASGSPSARSASSSLPEQTEKRPAVIFRQHPSPEEKARQQKARRVPEISSPSAARREDVAATDNSRSSTPTDASPSTPLSSSPASTFSKAFTSPLNSEQSSPETRTFSQAASSPVLVPHPDRTNTKMPLTSPPPPSTFVPVHPARLTTPPPIMLGTPMPSMNVTPKGKGRAAAPPETPTSKVRSTPSSPASTRSRSTSSSPQRTRPIITTPDVVSVPFQVETPRWPRVKIENLPIDLTVRELEKGLSAKLLPPASLVPSPCHFILHRSTGTTLSHAFVEVVSEVAAQDLIHTMDQATFFGRKVTVSREIPGEFARDLFCQNDFYVPAHIPHVLSYTSPGLALQDIGSTEPLGPVDLFVMKEICRVPHLHTSLPGVVLERPFLHLRDLIAMFPWSDQSIKSRAVVAQGLVDVAETAITYLQIGHLTPRVNEMLALLYRTCTECPDFTQEQKARIAALQQPLPVAAASGAPMAAMVEEAKVALPKPAHQPSSSTRQTPKATPQEVPLDNPAVFPPLGSPAPATSSKPPAAPVAAQPPKAKKKKAKKPVSEPPPAALVAAAPAQGDQAAAAEPTEAHTARLPSSSSTTTTSAVRKPSTEALPTKPAGRASPSVPQPSTSKPSRPSSRTSEAVQQQGRRPSINPQLAATGTSSKAAPSPTSAQPPTTAPKHQSRPSTASTQPSRPSSSAAHSSSTLAGPGPSHAGGRKMERKGSLASSMADLSSSDEAPLYMEPPRRGKDKVRPSGLAAVLNLTRAVHPPAGAGGAGPPGGGKKKSKSKGAGAAATAAPTAEAKGVKKPPAAKPPQKQEDGSKGQQQAEASRPSGSAGGAGAGAAGKKGGADWILLNATAAR